MNTQEEKKPDKPLVREMKSPFEEFSSAESLGGLLLLCAATAAVVLANSPLAEFYFNLREMDLTLAAGNWRAHTTLQHIVNDGLMAIFFFVVGLEIKRELLVGELSNPRKAVLPIAAAFGGMILPAIIYLAFNTGTPASRGWAIPMATDIAFALGVLALVGRNVPVSAKVFLMSLAIIDDLGAVLVIALFYTREIVLLNLLYASLVVLGLFAINGMTVKSPWAYYAGGIAVWLLLLTSGIHATIAGIVVAATIPVRSAMNPEKFRRIGEVKLQQFADATRKSPTPLIDLEQDKAIHELQSAVRQVEPPFMAIQHTLHPLSTFIIVPLFAFVNAGIAFKQSPLVIDNCTLGIALGLLIGKPLGIIGASWLALRLGCAHLQGLSKLEFAGISMLAGIGFTMSLFISHLAFANNTLVDQATMAILLASLIAMLVGSGMLAAAQRWSR